MLPTVDIFLIYAPNPPSQHETLRWLFLKKQPYKLTRSFLLFKYYFFSKNDSNALEDNLSGLLFPKAYNF